MLFTRSIIGLPLWKRVRKTHKGIIGQYLCKDVINRLTLNDMLWLYFFLCSTVFEVVLSLKMLYIVAIHIFNYLHCASKIVTYFFILLTVLAILPLPCLANKALYIEIIEFLISSGLFFFNDLVYVISCSSCTYSGTVGGGMHRKTGITIRQTHELGRKWQRIPS